jgi:hypothetical protein
MPAVNARRALESERGAELIEMAVVLPVLLLVIMGVVDFGFLFQRYVVLTNAVMEGARVATLPGYSSDDAEARVQASGGSRGRAGNAARRRRRNVARRAGDRHARLHPGLHRPHRRAVQRQRWRRDPDRPFHHAEPDGRRSMSCTRMPR